MKKHLLLIFLCLTLVAAIVFGWKLFTLYSTTFGGNFPATTERSDWGAMGDFFGGMLNPFFSILGLVMLLVTLFQNQKELELSRKELNASSKALAAQASTLEKQRFEDTFFSLLDQLNHSLDKLLSEGIRYNHEGKPSKKDSSISILKKNIVGGSMHSLTQRKSDINDAKKELLKHDPLLNQYFRILYQILKLIATNGPETSLKNGFSIINLEASTASSMEKFYSNIVRSFIPEDVYYLLAINCYANGPKDSYFPYKLLVERYALFEHMPLILPVHQNRLLINNLVSHYSYTAFGKNSDYPATSISNESTK